MTNKLIKSYYRLNQKDKMQENLQSEERQTQKANKYISNWKWRYHRTEGTLNLFDCPDDWVAALKIRDWSMLKGIDLGGNNIGENQLEVFANLPWPNLEFLWLFSNMMKPESLTCLKETNLNKLTQIRLQLNNIGGKGSKLLTKINMPSLTNLRLGSCCIGDEGAKHLSKGKWPGLEKLSIVNNFIGIDGREALKNNRWDFLEELQIWSNIETPISEIKLLTNQNTNIKIECWISNNQFKSKFDVMSKQYKSNNQ